MPSELAAILRDFTPGAAGVWTIALMVAGWMLREYRETRKMTAEDRLARRDGYAKQVELLTKENRALAGDLANLRAEYDKYRRICQTETDQLRGMIIDLERAQLGTVRNVAVESIEIARLKRGIRGTGQ